MIRPPGSSERPDLPLAIVIGGGGMGAGIARRIGAEHRLLIVDKDASRLGPLRAEMIAAGYDVEVSACDITDGDQLDALAAGIKAWRILVHVAALSPSMGDFRNVLTVNLLGARNVERSFGNTATGGSAGIFISSLAAHAPPPEDAVVKLLDEDSSADLVSRLEPMLKEVSSTAAYRLSKFAMNRMCRRRAAAWGAKGARILSLSPGLIATPMGALEFKGSPQKLAMYAQSPLQREGTILEIAATVAFLASPQASFITGTDILVDGGLAAALAFPQDSSPQAELPALEP